MYVFVHIRNDKPENKKHLAFRFKFVSHKMSTFRGKAYLFLKQRGSYSRELTVNQKIIGLLSTVPELLNKIT